MAEDGIAFADERVRIALAELPDSGVRAYLVDHPAFYDRPGSPYADPDGRDWPDNHRRFALLGWAAAALARGADPAWRPDILHAHDWHTALLPIYLQSGLRGSDSFRNTRSVFTIHNLNYQGIGSPAQFADFLAAADRYAPDFAAAIRHEYELPEGPYQDPSMGHP